MNVNVQFCWNEKCQVMRFNPLCVSVTFHLNTFQYSAAEGTEENKMLVQNVLTHFSPSVAFHIETSHLICTANQMTGLYMKCNTGLKWVKYFTSQLFQSIQRSISLLHALSTKNDYAYLLNMQLNVLLTSTSDFLINCHYRTFYINY